MLNDILNIYRCFKRQRRKKAPILVDGMESSELAPRDRPRWWTDFFDESMELELEMGGKLVLLEKILRHCERVGDKL